MTTSTGLHNTALHAAIGCIRAECTSATLQTYIFTQVDTQRVIDSCRTTLSALARPKELLPYPKHALFMLHAALCALEPLLAPKTQ